MAEARFAAQPDEAARIERWAERSGLTCKAYLRRKIVWRRPLILVTAEELSSCTEAVRELRKQLDSAAAEIRVNPRRIRDTAHAVCALYDTAAGKIEELCRKIKNTAS